MRPGIRQTLMKCFPGKTWKLSKGKLKRVTSCLDYCRPSLPLRYYLFPLRNRIRYSDCYISMEFRIQRWKEKFNRLKKKIKEKWKHNVSNAPRQVKPTSQAV